MEITVMTFNLRTSRANDGENCWKYRKDKAAQMIHWNDPLFVGIQEGNIDMLQDLDLSAYKWVGAGRRGGDEDEHSAIFYKSGELDVVQHDTFWLSEQPEVPGSISWDSSFPRICTWAHFRHKATGKELLAFNTHLDHRGQQAREQGIQIIWNRIQAIRAKNKLPVILTGDFNSRPDNPVIRFMRGQASLHGQSSDMVDAYSAIEGSVGASFSDNYTGRTDGEPIDYIFVSPDIQVKRSVIDRRTIDGNYASDHYPIVASLILR